MKTIRLFVGLAAMCALCSILSSAATAQCGPWGEWGPWYSYADPYTPFARYLPLGPTPPYFALHPPVYYGPRQHMAYGDSPLVRHPSKVVGWGRQEETPTSAWQSGLTIWNAFVADAVGESSRPAVPVRPQIVMNPYCSPNALEGGVEARIATRPPAPTVADE